MEIIEYEGSDLANKAFVNEVSQDPKDNNWLKRKHKPLKCGINITVD